MSFLVGFITGVAATVLVASILYFGPEKLRDGAATSLGFVIGNLMPFYFTRRWNLKVSSNLVKVDGEEVEVIRLDDRHEMIVKKSTKKINLSIWNVLPSGFVIGVSGLLSSANKGASPLEYSAKTTYYGGVMKIDGKVSIFTLSNKSYVERLIFWDREIPKRLQGLTLERAAA